MNETKNNSERSEQHEAERSKELFDRRLTALAEFVPEIAVRPEVARAGHELIEQFALKPSLFDDESRSLVFAAISSRMAEASGMEDSTADAEKTFSADALALLASDYSDMLSDAKAVIDNEKTEFDDDTRLKIYDKYTDKALTSQLRNAIEKDGLLDELKDRLGITENNEDAYRLRVISIGSEYQNNGLDAAKIDYDTFDPNNPVNAKILDEDRIERAEVNAWKQGLIERNKLFARELGVEGRQYEAWVTVIHGEQNLCISMPTAEKILDPTLTENTTWYSDRDRANDLAVLEHEYTHTQGGLNLDKDVTFGINLEELRAELFSGNKLGYQDIKGLFRDYEVVTGQNITEDMKQLPKGGTATEIYSLIANRVGLSNLLNVIVASPDSYIDSQSTSFSRGMHEHVGGIDGVLSSLIEGESEHGRSAEVEKRLDQTAARLVEIVNKPDFSLDIEAVGMFRKMSGSETVTDLILERARALQENLANK